jgi:chromosome segregation ATPase
MPSTGNATADVLIYVLVATVALLFGGLMWFVNGHFKDQKESIGEMSNKFDKHSVAMEEQRSKIFNIATDLHRDLEDHRKLNKFEHAQTVKEMSEVRKEAILLEKSIDKSAVAMEGLGAKTEAVSSKLIAVDEKVTKVSDRLDKTLVVLKKHDDDIKDFKTEIHRINDNLIILKDVKKKS